MFQTKLKILHTRYQKHHQWERLVHLGNGVTGKCHLCIDRTSNFRFCCKKVSGVGLSTDVLLFSGE